MQPHAAPCSPDTAARHPAAEPWRTAHLGPRPSAPSWPCSCVRQLGEDEDGLAYEIAIEQELGYLKGVGATFDAKAKVGRGPQPHPSSSVHPGPSRLYRARELVYAPCSAVHLLCIYTVHSTAQHSTAQLNTAQHSSARSARCARAVQELVLETWKASVVGTGHERVMSAAVPARVAIVGKERAGRGGLGVLAAFRGRGRLVCPASPHAWSPHACSRPNAQVAFPYEGGALKFEPTIRFKRNHLAF